MYGGYEGLSRSVERAVPLGHALPFIVEVCVGGFVFSYGVTSGLEVGVSVLEPGSSVRSEGELGEHFEGSEGGMKDAFLMGIFF